MSRSAVRTVLGLFAALFLSSAADAQLFRAYLSSAGSDANACTLAAPCRLLPAALLKVANNGEIWMLDSANYNVGLVAILKSVTILAVPGEVGSLVAQNTLPAIILGPAALNVKLRNLVIVNNVNNPGTDGIEMSAGDSLTLEGCLIAGMPGYGIYIATDAKVSVSNSVIRNSDFGIGASNGASVDVANVKFSGIEGSSVVGFGSVAGTTTRIAVSDSHFTNHGAGIYAMTTSGTATVRVAVTRSTFTMGFNGVASSVAVPGGVASVSVSDSLIAGLAGHAFYQTGTGAVIESFGNNTVRNNANNVFGTLSTVSSM